MSALVLLGLWSWPPFSQAIKDHFWRWPLLVLIVSTTGLATYPIEAAAKHLLARRRAVKDQERMIARLNRLTGDEKKVLRKYLQDQTTTNTWMRGVGIVDLLTHDGILRLICPVEDPTNAMPMSVYAISDSTWDYLNKHPGLIDLEHSPKRSY